MLKAKSAFQFALAGLFYFSLPATTRADTIYTYTGNAPTSFVITLDTSLTGAALDSLAPGTSILGSLVSLTITGPYTPPAQDLGGFPVGVGSSYVNFTPSTVQIGTDPFGNVTSWDIAGSLFASFPAFPGENPNDFSCTYAVSSTTGLDQSSLNTDNDVGLCPGGASSETPGNWAPISSGTPSTPEPQSYMLLGSGLIGLAVLARRRRKA